MKSVYFNKIIVIVLFIALPVFGCTNFFVQGSQSETRYIMELFDNDNEDLYGCSLLIKMSEWSVDEKWGGWDRNTSWRWNDGISQTEKVEGFPEYSRSTQVLQDPKKSLIYVGKWHHVKKIGKDIRLIGYQIISKKRYSYGDIDHQFELRDEFNEKIKEMKFTPTILFPEYTHKGDSECAIKWYDKYGYNAMAETRRVWARGFWGKLFLQHELEVTGKVIEAQE